MVGTAGAADYRFTVQPDWSRLPKEIVLGDVAGIAVDRQDRVYLFNRGAHPVVVLSKEGEYLNSWGHGLFANAHGAYIGPDRRFKREGPPAGMEGRRADDVAGDLGDAAAPNMSQEEIDAMMKPSKVIL